MLRRHAGPAQEGEGLLKKTGRWSAAWFAWLDGEIADLAFRSPGERAAVRRVLAKDPIAFALLYFRHHITDRDGNITWADAHFAWARMALAWTQPVAGPGEHRTAVIAPRECGKSTWWFLILPLWAAANGHSRFAAAFANAGAQAETHLSTFKTELETNALIRADYPDLCTPARRRSGSTVADRAGMLHQRNGFVFAARGIDAAVLGMKVLDARPDLIIMDDIEPDEANYSPAQAEKRLGTVTDAILPLNIYARVVFVGTVTMPGSIMHQLVKAAQGVETEDWIKDEGIVPHHFRPLVTKDDGTEVSIWPAKWPTAWLQSIRHTRSFAKNYDNDPMAREGVYWVREDFKHGEPEGRHCTRTILAVDPAVTSRKTSDFTGLAVVGYLPELRARPVGREPARLVAPAGCVIKHSAGVKLTGQHLKQHVLALLARFPEVRTIVIETNQGGDLWLDVFGKIPNIKVVTKFSSEPKEVRFATALDLWQTAGGRVWHRERFPTLEEQAVGFPRAPYDDVIDAAVIGVQHFFPAKRPVKAGATTDSY